MPSSCQQSVELEDVAQRIAMYLPVVDQQTTTQRASRSGSGAYIPCVGTIWEDDFTREVAQAWHDAAPHELPGFNKDWLEVKYPGKRGNCDLCLRGPTHQSGLGLPPYEWAIEMKYVRFIGDNGKNNDYGVTKVASPLRKDRSSVLDAERLQGFTPAKRRAIVMYGFEFDSASVDHAEQWSRTNSTGAALLANLERTKHMAGVLHKEDPDTHRMSMQDLIAIFEAAAGTRGVRLSQCVQFAFTGLERHPLYRMGRVLAWEVL